MQPNTLSVDEFFQEEYPRLLSYCHSRWNGNGEDILHQAYVLLRERYTHINFPLFVVTAHEAARMLKVHNRELPLYENIPQPEPYPQQEDPRLEKIREILTKKGVDGEEVLMRKDMVRRIQAEFYGQLPLFVFEREEGR